MRHPPVDDVHLRDPGFQGIESRLDLRDHPRVDRAIGDQVAALFLGEVRQQGRGIMPVAVDARDIAQKDQLFRVEPPGDRSGGGVGVDVVSLSRPVHGN